MLFILAKDYCGNTTTNGFTVFGKKELEVGVNCPNDTAVVMYRPIFKWSNCNWNNQLLIIVNHVRMIFQA